MLRYIIKRILWMIPVALGVIVIIFTLLYFTKGDPALVYLGSDATEDVVQEWREEHGLNDPYLVRLGKYIKELVIDGNLGKSYRTQMSVSGEIIKRFKVTAVLASLGVVFEMIFGIGMGILAATHQNSPLDRIFMISALLGSSVPGFAVALIVTLIFSMNPVPIPGRGLVRDPA